MEKSDSPRRRQAGSRWYSDYDETVLETIERVRRGQQFGLSLNEIGRLLSAFAEREPTKPEAISLLEERLKVIREKIADLREVEDLIIRKLIWYKNHPPGDRTSYMDLPKSMRPRPSRMRPQAP